MTSNRTDPAAVRTNHTRRIMGRAGEIWGFLKTRKKWWLTPIIVVLLLLSLVLVLAQGSALAPFIYAIF
jgi:hypothetical protein